MQMLIRTLLVWLFLCSQVFATIYYLREDGTNADSDCSETSACCEGAMDVSDHNGGSFSPGDIIYLCSEGGEIDSDIIPPDSGTSGGGYIEYDGYYSDDTTCDYVSGSDDDEESVCTGAVLNGASILITNHGTDNTSRDYIRVEDIEGTGSRTYALVNIESTQNDNCENIIIQRICDHETDTRTINMNVDTSVGGSTLTNALLNEYITIGGSNGNGIVARNVGTGTGDSDIHASVTTDGIISHNKLYGTSNAYGIDGIVFHTRVSDILVEYNTIKNHQDSTGNCGAGECGEDAMDLKCDSDCNGSDYTHAVKNIIVRYNSMTGNNESGFKLQTGTYSIIGFGNFISANEEVGIGIQTNAAAKTPCKDIYLWSNIVTLNHGQGVNVKGSDDVDEVTNLLMYNNIIAKNGVDYGDSNVYMAIVTLRINSAEFKNNIFHKQRDGDSSGYKAGAFWLWYDDGEDIGEADHNTYYYDGIATPKTFEGCTGPTCGAGTDWNGVLNWEDDAPAGTHERGGFDEFTYYTPDGTHINNAVTLSSAGLPTITIQGNDYGPNESGEYKISYGLALDYRSTDFSTIPPTVNTVNRTGVWDRGAYEYIGSDAQAIITITQ